MGCDIHMYAEIRTSPTGSWEVLNDDNLYDGRNYSLFAMLADVRNGVGFAGSDTGVPVTPIDKPRGLPDDVSPAIRKESDDWGVDGHSHSFFTLAELLAVDWDQKITHRAWVRSRRGTEKPGQTPDEFAQRLAEAANSLGELPPATYWHYEMCSWSSEGQGPSGWRTIEWTESWYTAAGPSWLASLMRLVRLAAATGVSTSDVRLVFWFDN